MLTGQFKLSCSWAGEISIPVFYLYPCLEGQEAWLWLGPLFEGGWSGSHDSTASLKTSLGRVKAQVILEVLSALSFRGVHRVVTLGGGCCEPAMFLSARSPSHPYPGGAGAAHGPLHCICSAWEPSSHPPLAAQRPGAPWDRDHPHGVLPTGGSVWGLPALQQTHPLQQRQLHHCGYQPAGLSQPNDQRTLPWKAFSR